MNKIKVCLIQSKVILTDIEIIYTRVEQLIREAVLVHNPDILILPEFWIGKYSESEFFKLSEFERNSRSLILLKRLSKELKVYIIGGSVPELVDKINEENVDKEKSNREDLIIYNTCYCLNRIGDVVEKHRKCHLFDVNNKRGIVFKESNSFGYGEKLTVLKTEFGNIGLGICYDIRFPELTKIYKEKYNCNLIVFPSNFSTFTGTMHWDILMKSRAVDNNCFIIKCSPSRNYENPEVYQSYGHSQVVSPYGSILATSSYEESIVYCEIDFKLVEQRENEINLIDNRRNDMYELILK